MSGYALAPPSKPNLYDLCQLDSALNSTVADIRDLANLKKAIDAASPEIIFHLAAQPLVRDSYADPIKTYSTNVMGTVNLFEAARHCSTVKAIVNITTDKCYENREWVWPYRENEPLGGYDPYSSSKACSELVTSSYRDSFFNPKDFNRHGVAVASARAGNVIGGGDWGADRLIPDAIRSIFCGKPILIRNPKAIRPWQHVLEPLNGYMLLAAKLVENPNEFSGAWNFGPEANDSKSVEWIVKRFCAKWGKGVAYKVDESQQPHEAACLKLDCSKAKTFLNWTPRWNLDVGIDKIIEWVKAYEEKQDLKSLCQSQISDFINTAPSSG